MYLLLVRLRILIEQDDRRMLHVRPDVVVLVRIADDDPVIVERHEHAVEQLSIERRHGHPDAVEVLLQHRLHLIIKLEQVCARHAEAVGPAAAQVHRIIGILHGRLHVLHCFAQVTQVIQILLRIENDWRDVIPKAWLMLRVVLRERHGHREVVMLHQVALQRLDRVLNPRKRVRDVYEALSEPVLRDLTQPHIGVA